MAASMIGNRDGGVTVVIRHLYAGQGVKPIDLWRE
jgi:hypothetical protein